jgi:outer membrane protein assembly factor BamA
MPRPISCLLICVALAVCTPAQMAAQAPSPQPPETREQALKLEREEKQKSLVPYTSNALERALDIAENNVAPLLFYRDGVHLKFGSLTTGSGFAYGAGYRHRRLFEREGALTGWAAASLKKYWAVEGRFDLPDLADGRLELGAYARYNDYPQEVYFGLGPAAQRGDETRYELKNTLVGGRAGIKPAPIIMFGGGLEYSRPEIGPGKNRRVASIETRFDEISAPGLFSALNYLRTSAFLTVDYRQPKNARRGGWYRVEASHYGEESDAFSFNRIDVDLRQFASVLAERRVFAVRLYLSTSDTEPGARMPFYLMPTLGGHDSLRGFRDYRFRGPHAILTNAEYRWEIWSGLDAALFYDAGKVALRRADLDFKGLNKAYGFGFRFNTDNGTILRIDAGFGSQDGKHLYIVFGDVF